MHIVTSVDKFGLPVVVFTTTERIPSYESARLPRLMAAAIAAGVVIYLIAAFPRTSAAVDADNGLYGGLFLVGLVVIAACLSTIEGAAKHFAQKPRFRTVKQSLFIDPRARKQAALAIGRRGREFWLDGYRRELSFTIARYEEWFGDQDYVRFIKANDLGTPQVIVTQCMNGEVALIAQHEGPAHHMARLHAVLTKSFITDYAQNMRILNAVRATWLNPSASHAALDDRPQCL